MLNPVTKGGNRRMIEMRIMEHEPLGEGKDGHNSSPGWYS